MKNPCDTIRIIIIVSLLTSSLVKGQSFIDQLAFQSGVGAASRARHLYPGTGSKSIRDYKRIARQDVTGLSQHETHPFQPWRAFSRIRVKKLDRIFSRVRLDRVRIKL